MRHILSLLLALCTCPPLQAQASVLTRDVDKRPLTEVSRQSLSPAMQREVQDLEDDARAGSDLNRNTPESLGVHVFRIPVAPAGHKLYAVELSGELGCIGVVANCFEAAFDETANGVNTIFNGDGVGITVVRRPNLQMPDIAHTEQEGHAAADTTVYRFLGSAWKPFLCKSVEPIGADPHPSVLADKPCKP